MKTKEQLKANYGPVYAAAMYPGLAKIFHEHGYALAVHGSVARDFDLIAVPWTPAVASEEVVLKAATEVFHLNLIGERTVMQHGRVCYTLSCGFGECSIDLSFVGSVYSQIAAAARCLYETLRSNCGETADWPLDLIARDPESAKNVAELLTELGKALAMK